MSKIQIRKWQFITILESIRDDMKLNTIDDIINDLNDKVKDDDDYVLIFNDIKLNKSYKDNKQNK